MLYPLSYEGGVCALSCANLALWSRFVAHQATSPTLRLLEDNRRWAQSAVGRVSAARSPFWGRLQTAPVLGGYWYRLRRDRR